MLPALLQVRSFCDGKNGSLSVLEESGDIPFRIRRVYYIYGVGSGHIRGCHGHKKLSQVLVVVNGAVDILLEGVSGSHAYHLESPSTGLLIPPGYWREMQNFSDGAVILVLASDPFSEEDYIREYGAFKNWLRWQQEQVCVPYVDLTRCQQSIGCAIETAISKVFSSGHFINGSQKVLFEEAFASLCGARYAVGVGNGLEALVLILEALGVSEGDEVVVCSSGFVATPLAVSRVGARPVFVDCDPGGNIDPSKIEVALTPACKAVLLTHLYGIPADVDAINSVATKHGVAVIEDACQAHGARYKNKPCGGLGTAAAFSFYPTKNLGAVGDGGCVVTNDPALAARIHKLGNYGAAEKYHHEVLGTNSRLDEIQAAVLLVKLPYLEAWNETRRQLAKIYFDMLNGLPGLALPRVPDWATPVWHVFPVRIKNGRRDALACYLQGLGISINIHYPCTLHRQECYAQQYGALSLPESELLAAEELSLPLDAQHTPEEIRHVGHAIIAFFNLEN